MNAVVAEFAVAPVPMPVPVVVDIDVLRLALAVGEVGPIRGGALPEFPIEPGGRSGGLAAADGGTVVVVPDAGIMDGADFAGVDFFDGLDESGIGAALGAELDDAVVLAGGLNG